MIKANQNVDFNFTLTSPPKTGDITFTISSNTYATKEVTRNGITG